MTETRTTCCYCGVGCGVIVESDGARITGVRGDPDHPANFGRLCTKGQTLHFSADPRITQQVRLLQPMRRTARGAAPQAIGWDEALDFAADRLAAIVEQHGPDAVGLYLSGQLLTEDYYVFNKLARGLIGTNNVDSNSRLCMSSATAAYKTTLGADAPPACYADIADAGALFIAGSNMAFAHPVLFRRIEDAKRANPALKIVVVDPRRTDTAEAADLHLAIAPGTDVALFHGLLHLMVWEGLVDPDFITAHTVGFDALRDRVRGFTPSAVARITGVNEADLVRAARWFALGGSDQVAARAPTLSLYCQGLNQSTSGTAKNAALINLHLACGQIGRRGSGPFSLTGQPNAMGGREVGAMATLLNGHRDPHDAADRAEVARLWGVAALPSRPGKTAVEMFEAAADGQIKALWIVCTNPAQSLPDQAMVRRALERAEFVIVQEAYATSATCAHADLLLPAASWGEKDGTVTNSERRISRVRAVSAPPGAARADSAIAADIARRLQPRLRPGLPDLFAYPGPEAIWNEHRESTRGRDLDITGLDYARIGSAPAQWPWPAGAAEGRQRLYADGRFATADGRARFFDTPYTPPAEPRDAQHPFTLNTGRLRDQWHGMTRTGTVARLFGHAPEPAVAMNPHDMARLGVAEGDLVRLQSRRASLVLPAQASAQQAPMQLFVPMHWGDEYLLGHGGEDRPGRGVNALTIAATCPLSKQPELKAAAVRVAKVALPWRLVALAWLSADEWLRRREALRPLLGEFAFATCVPFGRERQGLLVRAAAPAAPPPERVERIEALLGLDAADGLRYVDAARGQRRAIRLDDERLAAVLLAGDVRAESWLRTLLQDGASVRSYGRTLLHPGAAPPQGSRPKGRQICNCFDVSEAQIEAELALFEGDSTERLARLQQQLRCGTQCGSCLPELKRRANRRVHEV